MTTLIINEWRTRIRYWIIMFRGTPHISVSVCINTKSECPIYNSTLKTFVCLSNTKIFVFNLIETLLYSAEHSTVRCVEFRLYVSHHNVHLNLQLNKKWVWRSLQIQISALDEHKYFRGGYGGKSGIKVTWNYPYSLLNLFHQDPVTTGLHIPQYGILPLPTFCLKRVEWKHSHGCFYS